MIYRLRYCNKDGIEARVDIQKGLATPVIDVEGTERPFILSYNNDKGDKSGMFLSSSADIEIYETTDFNIDNLKTSNETELSVTHYINNVISWQGFIIPDFFSIEVRSNPVIVMTASDRLGTLKSVTLSDLPSMVNIRELAVLCLNKTGLTLPLKTMADFSNDDTDNAFFSYYIDSQRIKDVKGRSISCYNILSSILIVSRSKLVQRAGEWVIINKLQHEIGSGKLYSDTDTFTNYLESIYNFEQVSVGARRTIMPVAGSAGIYHEHGGRKSHPENYDYSLGLSGWNSMNGFTATIENRHIAGFLGGTPLFDTERTVKQYLLNYNDWIDDTNNLNTAPYISTDPIQINSPRADRVEVTVDISSTMAEKLSSNAAISFLRYAVILTNGVKTYTLTKAGIFEILDPENISGHSLLLRGGQQPPLLLASPAFSNSDSFKGLFEVGEDDDVNNYSATIRVYGSGGQYVTVNYALIKFSDVSELPKGTMYKTEQGEVFTKAYDIETSIFGDYLLSGLDGYFYRYPNDDTSSIYKDVNTLSTPVWTTPSIPDETSELPLLHHSMRQMRRMFSVAHDLLSAEIEVSDFDPLAIFVSCDKRYTVVSAKFDFFKSNLSVELEEVAFKNNVIREYIYSYFGDGESGIKSIGGISGGTGGGGSGGGLTPEQLEILNFWKKDPDNPNTIFTEMNAYSKLELSAYGAGTGGGGGGIIETVYGYGNLGQTFNNANLTDTFNAYTINQINTRLVSVENGSATTVNTTGTGNAITSIAKAGSVITANKGLTFSLSGHTHTISDITGLQNALNSKLETSIFNTHNNDNVRHITGAERTKWDGVVTDFAGLEIGGTNLIPKSRGTELGDYANGGVYAVGAYACTISDESFRITSPGLADPPDNQNNIRIAIGKTLQLNETYTLSFEARTSSSQDRDHNVRMPYSDNNIVSIKTGGWQRYSVTFKITNENTVNGSNNYFFFWQQNQGIYITYLRKIKLDKSNKATDWSPAPEDQVSDWNTTDVNSFSFIKNKPTTLSGYGITDAVTLNTAQTITGAKTFTAGMLATTITSNYWFLNNNATNPFLRLTRSGQNWYVQAVTAGVALGPTLSNSMLITSVGDVGIGTISPSEKLHVVGNILATGTITTTKVIFAAAGWSMEQVGSELQMKHNNVLKMRFTSTGSIVATGEITAFG